MSGDSTGGNSFERKILPVCDCAPRISSQFPAKLMIPIDQGEGVYLQKHFNVAKPTTDTLPVESIFHAEIHKRSARANQSAGTNLGPE